MQGWGDLPRVRPLSPQRGPGRGCRGRRIAAPEEPSVYQQRVELVREIGRAHV